MSEKRKVTVDGEEFEVILEKKGENWDVEIEGFNFSIKIDQGNSTNSSKKRKRGGSKRKLSGKISSSIPGKIVSLNVKLGDIVKQGQVVMILEAMKMQNEIQAPLSGEIIEINCLSGESIEANMPLIVIEPKDISKN
ncbi:TPA: biotin/lipoyl-binding protein [Candidatus Thalassarchaeaceae archaeon]|jgi:biotin carboxyl carrier protein|nr:biotin/lipoyl-binding protein [Euryarchaeota archaeon]MDG1547939.1 biotin/lipoyl-binding protein [Candidatus Thalassarchaeaceae archaeon]DAC64195.1 MAG TPA: biotin/lipoyl-binding protein [Candidatus Poseidoniales archaeon]MBT3846976.1 biotin/lipoyl-binding protein [Euryarchaeota archaeon]MBT4156145.1 biotin/lipoyl-binding protein [Euryarchaeota archaeon]|tara:strand:+ start:16131 stop:16541 length:411 start_codon:yes stop_codon:yes gene_type:complete